MAIQRIGRYEITREIGRGGMGAVFLARDPAMRRDVAVKVLTLTSDPEMMARFRAEAATTGNLRHKNIIIVHDCGEFDDRPYLVMEFLEGRSLENAIETGKPLTLLEKAGILMQMADGLGYAHGAGVVHRDIKPSNVMLLKTGGVKIVDFGISRFLGPGRTRVTKPGFMVGTYAYMAPEQFQHSDGDALTDIFSFGSTAYELLTGARPFPADSVAGLMYQLASVDPAPVRQLVPECPEELQRIIAKALAKDRRRRYQNFQDLLFDLAPVHATLLQAKTDASCQEAALLIEAGDFDRAEMILRGVLESDPAHKQAQELWRAILKSPDRTRTMQMTQATHRSEVSPPEGQAPEPPTRATRTGAGWQQTVLVGVGGFAAVAAVLAGWFWFHPLHRADPGSARTETPVAVAPLGEPCDFTAGPAVTDKWLEEPYRGMSNDDFPAGSAVVDLTTAGKAAPAYNLVIAPTAAPPQQGTAQVLQRSGRQVRATEQFQWDEHFENSGEYWSFDAPSKTLTLYSGGGANGMQTSHFRWNGAAFELASVSANSDGTKWWPAIAALRTWVSTLQKGDVDGHLPLYRDLVSVFYTGQNLSKAAVEKELRSIFATYSEFPVLKVSNMTCRGVESGGVALEFDKEYTGTRRAGGQASGKVRTLLNFVPVDGFWRISAERDLRVY